MCSRALFGLTATRSAFNILTDRPVKLDKDRRNTARFVDDVEEMAMHSTRVSVDRSNHRAYADPYYNFE